MRIQVITAALVAGALATTPAQKAQADAGDFIGGAIVGGLVTGAIMHQNQKSKQQTQQSRSTGSTKQVTRQGIPSTQQGRETQTALNYFGFNAGRVDGQVGRGTRAAIERYQVAMGYPVNGRAFSGYQYNELMEAYYWAINGGQAQTRLTGQPLLLAYRNVHQAPQGQTVAVSHPAPAQVTTLAPSADETLSTPEAKLPNLFAGGTVAESLANRCNSVMLRSSTNGGYTTLATLSDPAFTLEEQFCVARSYAISQGEQQMTAITGLTQEQITNQCAQLATSVSSQIDSVSLNAQAVTEESMRSFALGTGVSPTDLAATARVCLAVGYRQDDMRMAVGSALLLSAMGEPAYGELLGHHLMEGFGTTARADLAMQWFDAALTALEAGAPPAFMPGDPERTALLRAATTQSRTGTAATPVPVSDVSDTSDGAGVLPTFNVSQ
ncbi:MAG: peptidoglycan-binding domain-containing protein [Pseudomonadota bacterium]